MPYDSCSNVLIRGVNWIGDAVMTMPALKALRKAMPEARLSLLVKPWVSELFKKDPNIDELILYGTEYKGLMGKYRLSRYLKGRGFCLAILLQNAFDAGLITYLSGIPERIGYRRDGRGLLLTKPIPYGKEDRQMHHILYYIELLRRAGIKAEPIVPWIYLSLSERLDARKTLEGLRKPVLGINPGATYGSSKRWYPQRFAGVAQRFIEESIGSVVIFGGSSEIEIADEIMGHLPEMYHSRCVSMAGKTTLRQLISLISECDVFLTNDSGPMHIGYAVRTPLVSLFGSTEPSLTGPPEKGNIVIKKDIRCSPCFKRQCKEDTLKCMDAIGMDEVFSAVRNLIPKNRAVFFDRDGTLCKDKNYLNNWDDFEVFEDVSEVRRLKEKGFRLIGISNQSGIARGIIDEAFVRDINDVFIRQYGFDEFYYCPHHPDEHCPCRKPEPDMLLRARLEHGIDLKASYMIGDKSADIEVSNAVGSKSIHILTGQEEKGLDADFTATSLKQAVEWIIKDATKEV
ncbi:MAG: lipopolysaccharide heptosyltransferase II [Nitrospirae bacterium]|nr:lipopolysaccharide heptosyltransferase II [Nitrospirota bacterium]